MSHPQFEWWPGPESNTAVIFLIINVILTDSNSWYPKSYPSKTLRLVTTRIAGMGLSAEEFAHEAGRAEYVWLLE